MKTRMDYTLVGLLCYLVGNTATGPLADVQNLFFAIIGTIILLVGTFKKEIEE